MGSSTQRESRKRDNSPERPALDRLLTPADVAELTGLSVETLAQWRSQRRGIPFVKISRNCVRYDLRHTFATRAVASGTDLPTLSALLGHASIQMTMRYVHPAAEQKRMAIEKFERFRAEGIINAAAAQQSQGVTTKVTTVGRVN